MAKTKHQLLFIVLSHFCSWIHTLLWCTVNVIAFVKIKHAKKKDMHFVVFHRNVIWQVNLKEKWICCLQFHKEALSKNTIEETQQYKCINLSGTYIFLIDCNHCVYTVKSINHKENLDLHCDMTRQMISLVYYSTNKNFFICQSSNIS